MYLKRFLKYGEKYIFFIILYKYLRFQGYHGNKKYIKYWKKLENEISYIVLLYYSTYIAKIQKSILHNFRKAHFVCYTAPLWMEYLKILMQWNYFNFIIILGVWLLCLFLFRFDDCRVFRVPLSAVRPTRSSLPSQLLVSPTILKNTVDGEKIFSSEHRLWLRFKESIH